MGIEFAAFFAGVKFNLWRVAGMFKNWKTSLVGILAGVAQAATAAHNAGIHAGHVGSGDVIGFVGAGLTAILGVLASDYNKS